MLRRQRQILVAHNLAGPGQELKMPGFKINFYRRQIELFGCFINNGPALTLKLFYNRIVFFTGSRYIPDKKRNIFKNKLVFLLAT